MRGTVKAKHILITGGASFIGSHILDKLILREFNVAVLDNVSNGSSEFAMSRRLRKL